MGKIDDLIKKLCPDGVEWKTIKDIGRIVRGNGLQKKDFTDEGVGCIHYGQIYTRFGLSTDKTLTFVDSKLADKLTKVEPGNLVIACTSENIEDVCKSVVWQGTQTIVTGGHACVLKHHGNPKYIGYCFTTYSFQSQKRKHAYGAKVIDIKTEKLGEIRIPLPPLSIQQQIVEILDTFTDSISNLQEELALREKQMEYYRENLLSFDGEEVEWKTLKDVAEIGTGSSNTKDGLSEGLYPFYTRGQEILRKNEYEYDEEAIITAGDGVGVGKVIHYTQGKYALHQRAYRFSPMSNLSCKFLFYYMKVSFFQYVCGNSVSSSVSSLRKPKLMAYPIPVPSLSRQQEIVDILDTFESMIANIKEEIELRQKQYEYYREKLLTFD